MCLCVCRHDDAMRALEASHEKRFFGSKVTVSVHQGLGKLTYDSTSSLSQSVSGGWVGVDAVGPSVEC